MLSTTELELFVRTADHGSLSKAARSLGLLPATASASLKRMERELGARLLERSTRSMRLTPAGEGFLAHCRAALGELDAGIAAIKAGGQAISGTLRVSAPSDFGRNVLLPWLEAFQEQHAQLNIQVQCSDRHADLFRDPVDLALRYGRLADSSYVSQSLGANRRVLVAAPAYLERHGSPSDAQALQQHNCLLHNLDPLGSNVWRFQRGGKAIDIKVTGRQRTDDGAIIHAWALAGLGIAYKSNFDIRADLQAGRLVQLLPELQGQDWPLQAIYPHRASTSPAAKALTAYIQGQLNH